MPPRPPPPPNPAHPLPSPLLFAHRLLVHGLVCISPPPLTRFIVVFFTHPSSCPHPSLRQLVLFPVPLSASLGLSVSSAAFYSLLSCHSNANEGIFAMSLSAPPPSGGRFARRLCAQCGVNTLFSVCCGGAQRRLSRSTCSRVCQNSTGSR